MTEQNNPKQSTELELLKEFENLSEQRVIIGKLLYQEGYRDGQAAERERVNKAINDYFAGLVVIGDPQATLVTLLSSLNKD